MDGGGHAQPAPCRTNTASDSKQARTGRAWRTTLRCSGRRVQPARLNRPCWPCRLRWSALFCFGFLVLLVRGGWLLFFCTRESINYSHLDVPIYCIYYSFYILTRQLSPCASSLLHWNLVFYTLISLPISNCLVFSISDFSCCWNWFQRWKKKKSISQILYCKVLNCIDQNLENLQVNASLATATHSGTENSIWVH